MSRPEVTATSAPTSARETVMASEMATAKARASLSVGPARPRLRLVRAVALAVALASDTSTTLPAALTWVLPPSSTRATDSALL